MGVAWRLKLGTLKLLHSNTCKIRVDNYAHRGNKNPTCVVPPYIGLGTPTKSGVRTRLESHRALVAAVANLGF